VGKIIVVEDDADLREEITSYLSLSGLETEGVGSAAELYRRMAVVDFSILILDLRLPDESGLSIASYVRSHSSTGIIMVTAQSSPEDRLRGREAGADVYLPKPVDLAELVAAIRSLERRIQGNSFPQSQPEEKLEWCLDVGSFALINPGGLKVHLTANELALLQRLIRPCGVVVERGELLALMGYDSSDPSNRNLDAALRRLRLKVKSETGHSLPLRTIHAVGYVMQDAVRLVSRSQE